VSGIDRPGLFYFIVVILAGSCHRVGGFHYAGESVKVPDAGVEGHGRAQYQIERDLEDLFLNKP